MCNCTKIELGFVPDPNCLVTAQDIAQAYETFLLMRELKNYSAYSKVQLNYKISQCESMLKTGNYCMYEI